ncbi:AAA family ATPase [Proteiniclasticum ruminis]|uniref:AAA family ATPase n=1 Tax=Proteiniclasticum ruminis TaxID=398199 RepID=UPI0028AA7585|nr:AAA family ATPase [Proteiniclasticum ruminis]
MKIKKLHLKNGYKRFFDLSIELGEYPSRIIALVGPNGCGKSSVLDGMLFHANAHSVIGNSGPKDYKYHSMMKIPNYNFQNISIEFEEGNFSNIYRSLQPKGLEKTVFTFRSSYRYNSNLNIRETRALDEIRLNNYGATTSNDLDFRMEENYRRLYIEYNKYMNKNDCKPSEAKLKIIGDLNSALMNCLDLEIVSIGNIEANEGTLYFTKSDYKNISYTDGEDPKNNKFDFNVLSSGEKEVVDIILDLYLRKSDFSNSIYLIDEPELHISTTIQRKLINEIDKIIPDNCQIWIATHSIGMLRALQEELSHKSSIIRFDESNQWARESYVLNPMKKSRQNWQRIFSTALDDITALVAPNRIIYCEGRDKPGANGQEKGFDAEIYNTIFGEEFTNTLFVSSGGNTELDIRSEIAIAIIGKALPQTEILVLKDRDMASGKKVTENDRLEYLKYNSTNHRVLKRYEIENYLFDKEVLRNYCHKTGKIFKESDYDTLGLDLVDGDIKEEFSKIKNICSIVVNISKDKFKRELASFITPDMVVYKELREVIFEA